MPGSSTPPEPKYRIGFVVGFFLLGGAVVLDFIGFLLMLTGVGEIVTEILGVLGSIGFFILFFFLGAGFMQKKSLQKVGVGVVGSVIEMIPFLNGISPTFTGETASLIYIMRKEDKEQSLEKSKAVAQKSGGLMTAQEASEAVRARQAGNNNEGAQEQKAA